MKAVNKDNVWLPAIFDGLFFDNKIDTLNNWETFSSPAVNIIEKISNFVVEIAVPGMKKENFTIEVEKDLLTISGKSIEKQEEASEAKDEDATFRRREFNYKEFKRSFKLPKKIKTDDIAASYVDGILRITLPKLEEETVLKRMVEIS